MIARIRFYIRVFTNIIVDLFGLLVLQHKTKKRVKAKRNKKILIFNWRDTKHRYAGGAELYVHEIAKRFVKERYSVTIFCGNDGVSHRYETVDGVEIIRRGGFYFVYFWAFLYYISYFKDEYDIIIDCENGIPFFTPLYVRKKMFCVMFHVHQEVFRRSLAAPLAWIALFLEKRLMPVVYKNVNFITISNSSKEDMVSLGLNRDRINIVEPGVNLKEFKPGKKSKIPLVLYVGRLKFYKRVDLFIKIASKVIKSVPNVQFAIAGEGEETDNLKRLTKKLSLTDKITFLGKVAEENKVELYQKAWVFVNSSLMEGWGITTVEANACGTPVVASDVPGLRDSLPNAVSGYLVKYADVKNFSKQIVRLLKDSRLRSRMSKDAVVWSKNFSWDRSASLFINLIK